MNNAVFDRCFPFMVVAKSVDGVELANRTRGKAPQPTGPGKTGRPPKSHQPAIDRLQRLVDREHPEATAIALSEDDESQWLAGSIVRVVFPDGEERSFVLLEDVRCVSWDV